MNDLELEDLGMISYYMFMTKWTEERRRRQAEAIRKHKPWEKSTGPRTAKGKAKAALNATKHGMRSREGQRILKVLRLNAAFLKAIEEAGVLDGVSSGLIERCLKSMACKENKKTGERAI